MFFVLGLAALVLGAERLVRGASRLVLSSGISSLVAGLRVVAFGTLGVLSYRSWRKGGLPMWNR